MSKMIFINLPVGDLPRSMAFYEALGFSNNPAFTDDKAACMVWSEAIFVMLHTHESWRRFTDRPIPDAGSSEVVLAISFEDKPAVDALLETVAKQGGTADINPAMDMGFMYNRSFTDLDGHIWEAFWMDPAAAADGPPDTADAA